MRDIFFHEKSVHRSSWHTVVDFGRDRLYPCGSVLDHIGNKSGWPYLIFNALQCVPILATPTFSGPDLNRA